MQACDSTVRPKRALRHASVVKVRALNIRVGNTTWAIQFLRKEMRINAPGNVDYGVCEAKLR